MAKKDLSQTTNRAREAQQAPRKCTAKPAKGKVGAKAKAGMPPKKASVGAAKKKAPSRKRALARKTGLLNARKQASAKQPKPPFGQHGAKQELAAEKPAPPSFEEIARAAYLNYRRRVEHGLPGDETSDWLEALRTLTRKE